MNRVFTCILVDDEPLALSKVRGFASKHPQLLIKGEFENSVEALTYLNNHPVDLVFLDIKMDELSGMDFIRCSKVKTQFILTTAFSEFALESYDLAVTDYLLKPFTMQRFLQATQKAIDKIELEQNETSDSIYVKSENRLVNIPITEVLFIEGMGDYRRIHLTNKRIMTLETFRELEKRLPNKLICRVHKSYMVGIKHIESIERKRIKIGEKLIPISEGYEKMFFGLIG